MTAKSQENLDELLNAQNPGEPDRETWGLKPDHQAGQQALLDMLGY